MNRRMRTLLGGMSTASLIIAAAPALAQYGQDPPSCPTRSKTKVESSKDKAKDNAAAKAKEDAAAKAKANAAAKKSAEKAAAEKAAQTKAKASK